MRIFYSLTKRQILTITKFNKFLHGNSKEKKVFCYIFFAVALTVMILSFYWFRMVFQICMTFQSSQEILSYLLKPFVAASVFMTFLSALMKGSGILYLDKSIDLLFSYPNKNDSFIQIDLSIFMECLYICCLVNYSVVTLWFITKGKSNVLDD